MTPDKKLLEALSCDMQRPGKRSDSYPKRLHSINWVLSLDLSGLEHPMRMKHLTVYETLAGERILMAIPGKESKRKDQVLRPYDFFPLLLRADGTAMDDLSFGQAFGFFCELVNPGGAGQQFPMQLLAATVYRMAFMLDHSLRGKTELDVKLIEQPGDGSPGKSTLHKESLEPFYSFEPVKELLPALKREIPSLRVSVEGLLKYCDVIAWNEDSKYYYRAKQKLATSGKPDKEPAWLNSTGRVNMLLTGLTVLGYVSGVVKLGDLVDRFARQRGVAPVAAAEIELMTGGLVGPAQ
jgi:hypothetical protein